jgi:hypothetical protein
LAQLCSLLFWDALRLFANIVLQFYSFQPHKEDGVVYSI